MRQGASTKGRQLGIQARREVGGSSRRSGSELVGQSVGQLLSSGHACMHAWRAGGAAVGDARAGAGKRAALDPGSLPARHAELSAPHQLSTPAQRASGLACIVTPFSLISCIARSEAAAAGILHSSSSHQSAAAAAPSSKGSVAGAAHPANLRHAVVPLQRCRMPRERMHEMNELTSA